jgi:hypothetical protein
VLKGLTIITVPRSEDITRADGASRNIPGLYIGIHEFGSFTGPKISGHPRQYNIPCIL